MSDRPERLEPGPAPAPRIVAVLDPTRPGSPAASVAGVLALGAAATLEIVAVTTTGFDPPETEAFLDGELAGSVGPNLVATRLDGQSVVDAVLDHLARGDADLVVLASHGRTPAAEKLLGSISADLVRSASAPTLLVGPECRVPDGLDQLVVAVDGSDDSTGAFHVARHVAARLGLGLSLVEVAPPNAVIHGEGSDAVEGAELGRIARSVSPPVTSWDVLHGTDVAQTLTDHVATLPGAVLVVGTHGRTPGRPRVLGGVTARLVRHASVPVLAVSSEAAARRVVGPA